MSILAMILENLLLFEMNVSGVVFVRNRLSKQEKILRLF